MHHEILVSGIESMFGFSYLDYIAIIWFIGAWAAYGLALDHTIHGRSSLNQRMNIYREQWMRQMLRREMRMVDGQVTGSLQNGTAFFASSSLIAVGGALALFRASGDVVQLVAVMPFGVVPTQLQWEAKTLGLCIILVYAFFKFAWSYRLFNYLAIMLGAAPPASEKDMPEAKEFVEIAAGVLADAGRQFNRGQRAFFFALAYLGWFIGPLPFIIITIGVVIVMWRRQFASEASQAVTKADHSPPPPLEPL